jgi:O-antigen/teichoic acid export membrane protein
MVFGLLAVSAGLLALPFVYPLVVERQLPLSWMALVAALLLLAFTQWNQYLLDVTRLHMAPWRFFFISLISKAGSALLGLWAVVILGLGIDGLLGAQALVVLAVIPLALFYVRKDLTLEVDRTWIKELVQFGYPFIFAGLAFWLFGSMDRWMLAGMSSVEEVGVYSVAFRFATLVMFVSSAFGQAWSPVAIKIRTDNPEKYRDIYAQVLLLLTFLMLVIGGGLALFSGELIRLIMSPEYFASDLPLAILCFGIVLQSTQQVTGVGISLEKKTYVVARLSWLTALINLLLNYCLIPRFGAAGAAVATTASYIVLTSGYLYYTQKLHPLPLPWKELTILVVCGCGIAAVSIIYQANKVDFTVMCMKMVIGLACVGVGGIILRKNKAWVAL